MLQLNNKEEEEEEIFRQIYKHFPRNVEEFSIEHDSSLEHRNLLDKLDNARGDKRWGDFVEGVKALGSKYDIMNMTTYAYSTTCFKANIYVSEEVKTYEVSFYISIFTNYFAFQTKLLFNDSSIHFNLRQLAGGEKIKYMLDAIDAEKKHEEANKHLFNSYDHEVKKLIIPILDLEIKIFNYGLFPSYLRRKKVPGVSTNRNLVGQATVFDCVFTDCDS